MSANNSTVRRIAAAAAVTGALFSLPASAGTFYQLHASNISVDIPSPLFTSNEISGYLEISNSVGPGGSFGPNQLESFVFNIEGYHFTQADLNYPNEANPIDVDGRISADGKTIDLLEIGYDLNTALKGCSFFCDGTFNIALSSSPSNFVVVDDFPDDLTLGLVEFDAAFLRVPEPITISLFAAGLMGAGLMRRRKASAQPGRTA